MKKELIGKYAEIQYIDKTFKGTIVDETKNMLYLETSKGIKKFIKKNSIIKIKNHVIKGKYITKRPEDRIKKTTYKN